MVAAGEAGGILDTILQRLAIYIEKAVKLKTQVRSAMIYPISVISIAIIVVYIILWKVIPVFASLFQGLGADLPFLTLWVVAASKSIGRFWWLIMAVVAAAVIGLRQYYQTEAGRYQIDALVLKLPILGTVSDGGAGARLAVSGYASLGKRGQDGEDENKAHV